MAMLLVSHDLAVVARHCRRVLVMYGGTMMESGPVDAVLRDALHPYTQRAARSAPARPARRAASGCAPFPAPLRRRTPRRRGLPLRRRAARWRSTPAASTPLPTVELDRRRRVRCLRVGADGRLT